MFNLVLLGPPGAGKGTQASLLKAQYGVPHISTGDIFRKAMSLGTEMGLAAKEFIDQGKLVPDDVVIGLVRERLTQEDCKSGFILDGFPRTVCQAEQLNAILRLANKQLDAVISLEVQQDVLLRRLSGRRICSQCGALYHIDNLEGISICPNDGKELIQRSDDKEEAIQIRLLSFARQTEPLKDFYRQMGCFLGIDGLGTPELVFSRIQDALSLN